MPRLPWYVTVLNGCRKPVLDPRARSPQGVGEPDSSSTVLHRFVHRVTCAARNHPHGCGQDLCTRAGYAPDSAGAAGTTARRGPRRGRFGQGTSMVGMIVARRPATGARGCSSMVEHQLPKLIARVRFPSPAPSIARPQRPLAPCQKFVHAVRLVRSRASPVGAHARMRGQRQSGSLKRSCRRRSTVRPHYRGDPCDTRRRRHALARSRRRAAPVGATRALDHLRGPRPECARRATTRAAAPPQPDGRGTPRQGLRSRGPSPW